MNRSKNTTRQIDNGPGEQNRVHKLPTDLTNTYNCFEARCLSSHRLLSK